MTIIIRNSLFKLLDNGEILSCDPSNPRFDTYSDIFKEEQPKEKDEVVEAPDEPIT